MALLDASENESVILYFGTTSCKWIKGEWSSIILRTKKTKKLVETVTSGSWNKKKHCKYDFDKSETFSNFKHYIKGEQWGKITTSMTHWVLKNLRTVFPVISTGPQISAAPLGIHNEISASL